MNEPDTIIDHARTYAVAPPVNLAAAERRAMGLPRSCAGREVSLHRLHGVWLGKRSEIIDENGILALSYPPGQSPDRRSAGRRDKAAARARQGALTLAGERVLATDWWSANYYHWLCDTLPRLEAFLSCRDGGELLLPAALADLAHVRDGLAAYPQLTVSRYDPESRAIKVETLLVPSHVADTGCHHPVFARAAFDRLSRHFGAVSPGGAARRIYVTRRRARMRRVANEAAIATVLADHGFETVDFEDMSPGDQARLMAETAILAGPHGAGLANMGFMPAGGAVLEIRHRAGPSDCFGSLATVCGHAHYLLVAEPPSAAAHLHAADMQVAPDRLAALLRQTHKDRARGAPVPGRQA